MLVIVLDYYLFDGDDLGPAAAVVLVADPPNLGPLAAAPLVKPVRAYLDHGVPTDGRREYRLCNTNLYKWVFIGVNIGKCKKQIVTLACIHIELRARQYTVFVPHPSI